MCITALRQEKMPSKFVDRAAQSNAKQPRQSKRMPPGDRREQILDAAVQHFAEHGFEGGTRGVAQRLGVTQPLVYRYFPSKEDLIKAVYERIYIKRWHEEWMTLVTDKSVPLRERLIEFYCLYTSMVFSPEWIRIYVFSGLRGLEIHRWWLAFIEDHILTTICGEIRDAYDLPALRTLPVQPEEFEAYWLFHGGIFYYGMRKEVYGATPRVKLNNFIEGAVDNMLQGYPHTLRDLLEKAQSEPAPHNVSERKARTLRPK
jgi:AcrR family transcriptional regulator